MLQAYDDDPILKNNDVEQTKPCDAKSLRWCFRITSLISISILLISMTFVAWNQYSELINADDNDVPVPIAMLNRCLNQSWNVIQVSSNVYKILYTEKNLFLSALFFDTNCNVTLDLPFIKLTNMENCCKIIIWNTI